MGRIEVPFKTDRSSLSAGLDSGGNRVRMSFG
jgi:hypothetical protein